MQNMNLAAPIQESAARMLNPLQLAYIGDTVWDLMVRTQLISTGLNVHHMHTRAVALVNASAQAQALSHLKDKLTQDETDLVRRGRNARARHPVPRHQEAADYAGATGLEALIGYLYITGQYQRLNELWQVCQPVAPS